MRPLAFLAAVALAAGCSGTDGDKTGDFVGVWTGTGTVNTKCGQGAGMDNPWNDTITVTKGIEAPLLVVFGSCSLQMSNSGDTATLVPGQSCPLTRNGNSAMAMYTDGSFAVSGIDATFTLHATFNLGLLGCSYQATGTAKKMQK